jgi:lysyl endopeptidase
MIRTLLATLLLALALPAAAQAIPAANYTDMWWNDQESGWGVSFTQHNGSNQAYAVWYTYDPRAADVGGTFKPLWIVMSGGTWTSPTSITGAVYVLNGTSFAQAWNPQLKQITPVGTFTLNFSSASSGTFTYNIAAPGGLAANDPAFGLPPMSGTKTITRNSF